MAVGRPIEFDRDRALAAAMRAFWSRGYEATSMHDLLKVTKLSKSSLYQTFGGKQQLFGRCIARYTDQMVTRLRQRLDASESAIEFIRATLTEIATERSTASTPQGCLIINTAAEFGRREAKFAHWVDVGMSRICTVLEIAVERGQRNGEIAGTRSAALLADYLIFSIAGLRTMVKAGTKPASILEIVSIVVGSLRHGEHVNRLTSRSAGGRVREPSSLRKRKS